jgi:hypothetical protein
VVAARPLKRIVGPPLRRREGIPKAQGQRNELRGTGSLKLTPRQQIPKASKWDRQKTPGGLLISRGAGGRWRQEQKGPQGPF